MLVRVVRAVLGSILLLAGLPLLLAGGALWFAMQHRDAGGAFGASLSEISTEGYAVVASDVDALLRRDAPFARGGRTTLRVSAHTDAGPAFVGLAPAGDVARYLAGVPYARVDQVQLARGPLPVVVAPVDGDTEPTGPPHAQPFWLAASAAGSLEWAPAEQRSRQLALVVMDQEGRAPLSVDLAAEVRPQWLGSTTYGALVLGTVLVLLAVAALAWPSRRRDIVYVVPPAHLPAVAAHLGVPLPPAAAERSGMSGTSAAGVSVEVAGAVAPPEELKVPAAIEPADPPAGQPAEPSTDPLPDPVTDTPTGQETEPVNGSLAGPVAEPMADAPPRQWPLPVATLPTAAPQPALPALPALLLPLPPQREEQAAVSESASS